MRLKLGLGLVVLLLLCGWLSSPARVEPLKGGGLAAPSSSLHVGPLESLLALWRSGMIFMKGVADSFMAIVSRLPRECLGGLLCLDFPLALVGLWTLSNFGRILGLFRFRDGARSLLHE